MKMVPKRLGPVLLIAVCSVALMAGCNDAPRSPVSPMESMAAFGKSTTTSVTVTATNPAFGDQGQTNESVTITGSGFKSGAQVAFLRNGSLDTTIVVSSAQATSSTTIVAVINIGKNSPLDFRDVQVTNSDRTQGIGASVFEVTQAQIISGTTISRSVNDNGEATGSLTNGTTFYYNISTGLLQTVSAMPGTGVSISQLGNAIVGTGGSGGGFPYLYTRTGAIGTPWTATPLPIGPTSTGGTAQALVSDPVTGDVTMIGGYESLVPVKGSTCTNPVIWSFQASTGTWQRIVLPKGSECYSGLRSRGLSANGTAVGFVGLSAAVWTPDGSGGYTLGLLAGGKYGNGINADASMIVGETAPQHAIAVYWKASAGGWGNAIPFVGGCSASRDIADVSGRATLNNCPFPGTSVTYASYIDPPYTTITKLGGVGGHNNNFVGGISPSGNYMVGYGVTSGGVQVGAYWRP